MSTGTYAKRERERAKQARAEQKRERRANRAEAGELDDSAPVRAEADVLAELARLHDAHRSGQVTFDDFEVAKADLIAQLQL